MPHITRSGTSPPSAFLTAAASTSEVAIASEPAIASSCDVHALVDAHLQRLAHGVDGLLGADASPP